MKRFILASALVAASAFTSAYGAHFVDLLKPLVGKKVQVMTSDHRWALGPATPSATLLKLESDYFRLTASVLDELRQPNSGTEPARRNVTSCFPLTSLRQVDPDSDHAFIVVSLD